jgi:hypothetical protein
LATSPSAWSWFSLAALPRGRENLARIGIAADR